MTRSLSTAFLILFFWMGVASGNPAAPDPSPTVVAVQAPAPNDPPVFGQFAPLAVDLQPNDQALAMLLIGQQTLQKLTGGVGGPLPRAETEPRQLPVHTMALLALAMVVGFGGIRLFQRGTRFHGTLLVAFASLGVAVAALANQAAPARPQQPKPGQVIVIQIAEGDQVRVILDRVSLERLNELAKPREKH